MKSALSIIVCAAAAALLALAASRRLPPTSRRPSCNRCAGRRRSTRRPSPRCSRLERDQPPIARDFVQQPPLIPHTIRGYQITKNFNKCMDCHAWSKVKETGATKVSGTHFKDSTGTRARQHLAAPLLLHGCHVPQTDAKPLVANTYKPLVEIAPAK